MRGSEENNFDDGEGAGESKLMQIKRALKRFFKSYRWFMKYSEARGNGQTHVATFDFSRQPHEQKSVQKAE